MHKDDVSIFNWNFHVLTETSAWRMSSFVENGVSGNSFSEVRSKLYVYVCVLVGIQAIAVFFFIEFFSYCF